MRASIEGAISRQESLANPILSGSSQPAGPTDGDSDDNSPLSAILSVSFCSAERGSATYVLEKISFRDHRIFSVCSCDVLATGDMQTERRAKNRPTRHMSKAVVPCQNKVILKNVSVLF